MTKKFVGIIIAFVLMTCTCSVFASNEMNGSMDTAVNTVRGAIGGAENVVEDAANGIGAGIQDLGNTFSAGASRVNNGDRSGDYSATRTSTTDGSNSTLFGMSANTWTWFILAIVALAIVGLVWYYAMQNNNEYTNNNTNNH